MTSAMNEGVSKRPRLGSGPGQESAVAGPGGSQSLGPGDIQAPGEAADGHQYRRTFSRTFVHYIEIADAEKDDRVKWTPDPNGANEGTLTFDWGWLNIEYWRLNASMTIKDMQTHFTPAKRFRVISMGFKISNIIPTTEELTNIGGTLTETLTFNQRPYMFTYVDDRHALFQNAQANRSKWSQAPNSDFTVNLPVSRAQGNLNYINDFRTTNKKWAARALSINPDQEYSNMAAEDLMSPFNTDGWSTLHVGETWSYTWNQTSKLWFPVMEFSFMGSRRVIPGQWSRDKMVGEVGPWNQSQPGQQWTPDEDDGGWPGNINNDAKTLTEGNTNISKMITTLLPFHNNCPGS